MLALVGTPALGRPFTIDDLLRLQRFEGVYVAPDGRRAVLQTLGPTLDAPGFDNETAIELSRGRLYGVDLRRGGPPVRIAAEAGGLWAGPFSPSGRAMVVYRFTERRLEVGVLDIASQRARWLGAGVLRARIGSPLAWRGEHQLVLLSPTPGHPPEGLGGGSPTHDRLERLWRRTAVGQVGVTTVGSGRYAGRDLPATSRLVLIDLRRRRTQILAAGRFNDLALNPSGRQVALSGWEEDAPLASHKVLGFSDVTPRRRLDVVNLVTGERRRACPDCDLISTVMAWSPRGDRLLVFARRPPNEAWSGGDFLIVDAKGVHTVGPAQLRPSLGSFGTEALPEAFGDWWGDDPLIYAHQAAEADRSDWWRITASGAIALSRTLSHPLPDIAGRTLDRLALRDAESCVTVDGEGRVRSADGACPPEPWPAPFTGLRAMVGPPPLRQGLEPPAHGVPALGPTPASAAAARILARTPWGDIERRTDAHGAVVVAIVGASHPRTLLRLNRWLDRVDAATPLALPRTEHGVTVIDWLFQPPFAGVAKPPLVVVPYPGFVYASAPMSYGPGSPLYYSNVQWLAAQGYAVLVPSLPMDASGAPLAEGIAAGLSRAVDAVLARGVVDASRLALWGHSFGGYAALVAAEHDPRYRAVVVSAGPTDLASLRGVFPQEARTSSDDARRRENWMGWSEGGQAGLGAPPWKDPALYARNSPVFGADRISAPVLLLYGDQDFVGVEQGQEMFSALKRQDKDALLVTFWGEDHLVSSPANMRFLYRTVGAFLSNHLESRSETRADAAASSGRPLMTSASSRLPPP